MKNYFFLIILVITSSCSIHYASKDLRYFKVDRDLNGAPKNNKSVITLTVYAYKNHNRDTQLLVDTIWRKVESNSRLSRGYYFTTATNVSGGVIVGIFRDLFKIIKSLFNNKPDRPKSFTNMIESGTYILESIAINEQYRVNTQFQANTGDLRKDRVIKNYNYYLKLDIKAKEEVKLGDIQVFYKDGKDCQKDLLGERLHIIESQSYSATKSSPVCLTNIIVENNDNIVKSEMINNQL